MPSARIGIGSRRPPAFASLGSSHLCRGASRRLFDPLAGVDESRASVTSGVVADLVSQKSPHLILVFLGARHADTVATRVARMACVWGRP